ncbi:amidase [Bordetella petrii]|uniref:Amidase n=1 Tax=Bordetella petrii TaxID=94624 RepID=A0ABT7W725_9BORD|nr:amidase [Bordetella petrii]MDM9560975.1 amidase [Bordetella petrii]
MQHDEYESLDGLGMAALLKSGDITTEDLMRCAVELGRSRGSALNALCYEQYEASLELARNWQPRGAFRGIPFLLKDSGLPSTRFPSSLGSRLLNDTTYECNGTVTDRFEQAGLIAFARSTVPEFCMGATTEAVRNGGPTRNPWGPDRSAGGSSGGAAAAVAARIVPLAHGSDGGGSIRIPAACCGVYGLKASRGRVPMGPLRGEGWGGMATDGVLSLSVRDTAAAMDAIAGYEPGAPYACPPQTGSYLDAVAEAVVKPFRIAVWRSAWNDIAVAPEPLQAVEGAAELLRGLGHTVVDSAPPPIDYEAFVRAHACILASNIVLSVDTRLKLAGKSLQADDLEPAMISGYEFGKTIGADEYIASVNRLHAIGRAMETYMQEFDLVLAPALTELPVKLGELSMQRGTFLELRHRVSRYATFMAVFNASGQPAASLPLFATSGGVPVAAQLVGRFGREDVILQVSAQLERAAPWRGRKPAF